MAVNSKIICAPLVLFATVFCSPNLSYAAEHDFLSQFGKVMQIVNPLVAAGVASQEKGIGHFMINYAQVFAVTHSLKLLGQRRQWKTSQRPYPGCDDWFGGIPSGHTASTWAAAAYVRTFAPDHKFLAIPLYLTAVTTGYSRIHNKTHTGAQVLAAGVLAEALTYINSKLSWSRHYQATIVPMPRGIMGSVVIKL